MNINNQTKIVLIYLILVITILLILFILEIPKLKQLEDSIDLKMYEPKPYQNSKSFLSSEKLLNESLVYGSSIVNTLAVRDGAESYVNFVIDSRLLVNGKEYYLGMPCMSENTYASDNLFQSFNYEFTPVFERGSNKSFVFKTRHKDYKIKNDYHKEVNFNLEFKDIKILETNEELLEAMKSGKRLIGITQIFDDFGKSAIIEYPIKTINFLNEKQNTWQVDTGAILLPINNSFEIAQIAFTNPDWVDILIRDNLGNYNQYIHIRTKNIIATYEI